MIYSKKINKVFHKQYNNNKVNKVNKKVKNNNINHKLSSKWILVMENYTIMMV